MQSQADKNNFQDALVILMLREKFSLKNYYRKLLIQKYEMPNIKNKVVKYEFSIF